MTEFRGLKKLEQWMTYVRWFGVAFGLIRALTENTLLSATTENAAWATVAILAIGSLLIWGASGRITEERDQRRLGVAAFIFDTVVIMSLVWIYAGEQPLVTWALLILIPLEAALRFRLAGALVAVAAVALFFVPQSIHVAALSNRQFDSDVFIFVVSLAALVAGIAGSMADNWHAQSVELEAQRFKLAEADRLKDRFLAVTSHEIRGPLTAIISGVDTVRKRGERLSAEQKETLLEIVSLQGHQLARLVDDLLVTSQLQEGQVALQPEWCDLDATIDQALEGAEGKRRGHRLERFVEAAQCEIDPARVGQVVRNLVENAYKYTPEHASVSISAKTTGDGLSIEVSDDGEGIPEDKRDQLFDAFTQLDGTTAGKDGVGLGLFVVSQLVAAMDGRIDLTSSSQGTTFRIHVPCHVAPQDRPRLGLVRDDEGPGQSVSSQRP